MPTDAAGPAEGLSPFPLGVTTAREERPGQRQVALGLAQRLGAPWIERRGRGVARILAEEGLASLIAVNAEGVMWCDGNGGRCFWHPNMALVRIRSAQRSGLPDPLARAAGARAGDHILDATLGLGADAIVLSEAVGPTGRIVGLEASPVLAALAAHGLATYPHRLAEALRRVEVVCRDYREYLAAPAVADAGWAVICFDPMFEHTVTRSNGLEGVRRLACYDRLAPETIARARTLVTRAVVVKGRSEDPWLAGLGPDRIVQGRHNRVAYGVFGPAGGNDADLG
jgi:hypothetical protein